MFFSALDTSGGAFQESAFSQASICRSSTSPCSGRCFRMRLMASSPASDSNAVIPQHPMIYLLNSTNLPDIKRCSQCKYQTGKQNCRCCPFKLPMFPIIKVCRSQFSKKEHGKDQIYGWKYNMIDNCFDLLGCRLPGSLNRPGHVPGSRICRHTD